jgi:uncharacterized protein YabE (DUF348 family)/3D (Asp-Asp-Asp) domain-containing protein
LTDTSSEAESFGDTAARGVLVPLLKAVLKISEIVANVSLFNANVCAFALKHLAEDIHSYKNWLPKRRFGSLFAALVISIAAMGATSALYAPPSERSEVVIRDEQGEHLAVVTAAPVAPEQLLDTAGVELGELDDYHFTGWQGETVYLTVKKAVTVTVSIDGKKQQFEAKPGDTIADVLDRENIVHGELDFISVPADSLVTNGEEVILEHPYTVPINFGGKLLSAELTGGTVWDALKSSGVLPDYDDVVSPPLNTKLTPFTEIIVQRISYVEREIIEPIEHESELIASTLHSLWFSEVTTVGVNGSRKAVTRETVINGEVQQIETISEEILNEPVTEVLTVGTALKTPYSKRQFDEIELENGLPKNYTKVISGKAYAYTGNYGSSTASGRKLQIGTIAVDPKVIPYGTLVYIVSQDGSYVYGAAVAADTGYLTDCVADLYMGTHDVGYDAACNFGMKYVDIYVINQNH